MPPIRIFRTNEEQESTDEILSFLIPTLSSSRQLEKYLSPSPLAFTARQERNIHHPVHTHMPNAQNHIYNTFFFLIIIWNR